MSDGTTLVLGATGKAGRRIVPRLRLRGLDVRPASRSSAVPFDWADPAGWDAVLDGVVTVWIVAPYTPGPVPDFVARAKAAGVAHLVLLSGRGAEHWPGSGFGADMLHAEEAVRGSDLAWTVLRPCNFAQNFDEEVLLDPVRRGEVLLPAGTLTEPLIDLEDVADVAAAVLAAPHEHVGRIHELTGPRALTYAEAVALIATATGREITYRGVAPAEHTADLLAQGLDRSTAAHITAMFGLIERGALAEPTDGVRELLGRAPRSFEDYVVRIAAGDAWRV